MKKNYVLFVAGSMLILLGWNYMLIKKQPPVPPRSAAVSPAASTLSTASPTLTPAAPAASTPEILRETLLEKSFGRHQVVFNAHGAGVRQWTLADGNRSMPLIPRRAEGAAPLAAFPGIAFTPKGEADFEGSRPDGLKVRQTYAVDPDGHLHTLTLALSNPGKTPLDASFSLGWGPGLNESLAGHEAKEEDAVSDPAVMALEGDALRRATVGIFNRSKGDLPLGTSSGDYRWFGVLNRYFLAAFLNESSTTVRIAVAREKKDFSLHRLENITLAPGEKKEFVQKFYLGPKSHADLKALGIGLERSIDFGMFDSLGKGIHWLLLRLHEWTGNFGWSIILLTAMVQVLVSPLTIKGFNHAQKMKALQPQLKRIQELHKGDPRRLNQEMLALYQRHGMKFMGMEGCLPMLVQMPVFFALYSVLSSTFELRHAPWILWIADLSMHDPYYVLPLLNGAAMFLQQRLMVNMSDPMQRQMMYMMPVMFTFMLIKMPSGLVVYWITNSLLAMSLQFFLLKRHAAKTTEVVL